VKRKEEKGKDRKKKKNAPTDDAALLKAFNR
jgi:hypothetical protein